MIASIFQSLTALLLAGALLYPVFSHPRFLRTPLLRDLSVGAIFAVTIYALTLASVDLPGGGTINAKAGVLILSGYLAGPLGGAIALTVAFALRVEVGGEVMPLGLGTILAYYLLGLALRRSHPIRAWPVLPRPALKFAAIGFVLVQLGAIVIGLATGAVPDPENARVNVIAFFLTGILSLLLLWFIVHFANRFADDTRQKIALLGQLKAVMERNRMGAFTYPGHGDQIEVDQGFLNIYEIKGAPGLWPIETFVNAVHPDDRDDARSEIKEAIAGHRRPVVRDFRVVLPKGDIREFRAFAVGEPTPENGIRITGFHSDMTDMHRAEVEHAQAEHQLATIAENIPGVIAQSYWANGEMRRLLYIGPKCEAYWGYAPEAIMANRYLIRGNATEDDIARFMAAVARGVETGDPIQVRVPLHNKNGELFWFDFRAKAVKLPGDPGYRIDGIYVDVTGEVAANEEAQAQRDLAHQAQKNESIGKLTGGVAHDFNNILAVILGNLELLREHATDPRQLVMIDAGIDASKRGADLTRSLLAFARRARLQPELLDLNEVARQAKNWMRRALPESVEVETSLLAGLWQTKADVASLESALLNLILNARDAMDGQGKLTIETANVRIDEAYVDARNEEITPGRYVMLAVSDTGSGIPEGAIGNIFEPFYTTKPPGAGSGVGLSMVMGFVRQSGGTVQVYSEPGRGTTFKLYFPVTDEAAARAPTARKIPAPGATGQQRILLAEDEEAVRDVLVATLEKAGYEVVSTHNGDTALDLFERDSDFDLLVTDIVMPGEHQGTGLARALRGMRPNLPVVFLSGYAAEATVHGNGLRPEDIRLMKPVPRDDLLIAVSRALAQGGG